ncbi:MAG TPA: hypothetical protein VJM11_09835 [Nevskiaceae bacterium]|nr:hypothetical protein [Nevskiaceae bacterium]
MSARVLIDALNVAYWCGEPPTLRVPLALAVALLASGVEAILYFDANAKYRLPDEGDVYARLVAFGSLCVEVPSGRRADGVMLRDARDTGAVIVTRDRFRDHRQRYRKLIDDPSRVVGGTVRDDRVRVPSLDLDAPLPASAEAAWIALEALIADRR